MKLMTSLQVMDFLAISRPTLYLWVKRGKIRPVRAGRALLFEREEIMRLLGYTTTVNVWIAPGTLEEAKARVRQWIQSQALPTVRIAYLEPPQPTFIRARVVEMGESVLNHLVEAKKQDWFVFLGHAEDVWRIAHVRPETKALGKRYIALELTPPVCPEDAARKSLIEEVVQTMRRGIIQGKVTEFSREELHGRRSS